MTLVNLLEQLKAVTGDAVKDLLLPVRAQKGDTVTADRPATVYKMRLLDSTSATKKAPYIIHQIVTSKDTQPSGQLEAGSAVVRSIFCVSCNDEQEGALHLLNLMERLRIRLLQDVVIGGQFELDLEAGIEVLIYPENTAPYFAGEMSTTWKMPSVERKWREWL